MAHLDQYVGLALKRFVGLLKPEKHDVPESVGRWIAPVSTNYEGEFKNTKPASFRLGMWVCSLDSWRDLVRDVVSILQYEHPHKFEEVVLGIHGQSRKYFSKDRNVLSDSSQVNKSDVYVETNLSANNAVQFTKEIVAAFGYSRDEFDIKLR
jgi:hypothetical protein